ncbi:diguanylate cyclase [Cellvibrio sp. NN19]|uniref:GGDEF domain-containing protein n=1 Tax=Cellvibrio chitinivorans TaxID=3102792 RepID=UPI002B40F90C|nr:diguanylate cyclase [Cellvibrio sp. NN19]
MRVKPRDLFLVFSAVFIASLLGILARPSGLIAAFWPANAILLGLMVRDPRRATLIYWCVAAFGNIAADLLMGSSLFRSLILTAGNLAGIIPATMLYHRLSIEHRRLQRPDSMIRLALIALFASVCSGIVGMFANPVLFDGSVLDGFLIWMSAEFANYLCILPVMLALSGLRDRRAQPMQEQLRRLLPLLAFIAGIVLSHVVHGPAALSFPIPGLLWCALVYRVWTTAVLSLVYSLTIQVAVVLGDVDLGVQMDSMLSLLSFRIGVALMAMAPVMVAGAIASRDRLLKCLQHTATHDALTGVLNRGGWLERAELMLEEQRASRQPITVMLLDLDYFKRINDRYGHDSGDIILTGFARSAAQSLRSTDLFGRFGGEEFVALLPGCSREAAQQIAERLCSQFASQTFVIANGESLQATVSVGAVFQQNISSSLHELIKRADEMLYQAKADGRNRVVFATPGD